MNFQQQTSAPFASSICHLVVRCGTVFSFGIRWLLVHLQ